MLAEDTSKRRRSASDSCAPADAPGNFQTELSRTEIRGISPCSCRCTGNSHTALPRTENPDEFLLLWDSLCLQDPTPGEFQSLGMRIGLGFRV